MRKVRSGSIIETDDGSFWYSCGSWTINNMHNAIPCILAYILKGEFVVTHEKMKILECNGKVYLKTFGLPIEIYRLMLESRDESLFYPLTLGKVVFLKCSRIIVIKDPVEFRSLFVQQLKNEGRILNSLCDVLQLDANDVGISGSSLMFTTPEIRHEIDFVIFGREKSRRALSVIHKNRNNKIFSDFSLPHLHLPFQFMKIWFDPQFSESDRIRHHLDKSSIHKIGQRMDIELRILDDKNGIFFPAIYKTSEGYGLLSFRAGQRGLFCKGQTIRFDSLPLYSVTFANGKTEIFYAILNDEWGTII